MATTSRRARLMTIQELLNTQRASGPARCGHCGRDAADRDHELVQQALQLRIRGLEARIAELEGRLASKP
jgi:DNA-binding transcriptional MerR regulator